MRATSEKTTEKRALSAHLDHSNSLEAPAQRFLDTRQAAALLGVSMPFLEGARYRGQGPPYLKLSDGRSGRGGVRYDLVDLLEWADGRKVRSTSEHSARLAKAPKGGRKP